MKKKDYVILAVLVVLLISLIFIILNKVFFRRSDGQRKIRISGGTSYYGPKLDNNDANSNKKTETYDIELNKKIVFKEGSLGLEFTVIEIKDDGIKIKTESDYSIQKEDDSTGWGEYQNEFFIKNNSSIEISTPTMDAGGNYKIEIIN